MRNPQANETLRHAPQQDWEYDMVTQGYWVKRGSATHTLSLLLGIEPYENWPESGTWDRNGRIR